MYSQEDYAGAGPDNPFTLRDFCAYKYTPLEIRYMYTILRYIHLREQSI